MMKMSKHIIIFIIIFVLLTISVSAEEALITIVLPNTPEATTETAVTPPKQQVESPKLYPVSVTENIKLGRREIVKTYELSPKDKPSDIPRDSFERDGWFYEIADITKKENIKTEEKNQTETVKIDSATKDFDEVLQLLPKSKSYNINGFTGTLTLDANSITVEQAGTRNEAYTISETREYPYLSSNDSSFVPKTIADKYNRTLTLSSLNWKTQGNEAVDYAQIPESYTAVVTYTATAYKTVVTGYKVTAQYRGVISKTSADKTIYTTLFIGTEIVSPVIPAVETTETTTSEIIEEMPEILPEETTAESTTTEMPTVLTDEYTKPQITETEKNPINSALIILLILTAAAFIGFIIYHIITKKRRNSIEQNN